MTKEITKTELRKNIIRTDGGRRINVGFYIDDEPYFLAYQDYEFDFAENFETLAIDKFINGDLNSFYGRMLNDEDIKIYYRKTRIV